MMFDRYSEWQEQYLKLKWKFLMIAMNWWLTNPLWFKSINFEIKIVSRKSLSVTFFRCLLWLGYGRLSGIRIKILTWIQLNILPSPSLPSSVAYICGYLIPYFFRARPTWIPCENSNSKINNQRKNIDVSYLVHNDKSRRNSRQNDVSKLSGNF